jgi:hypothetical protein
MGASRREPYQGEPYDERTTLESPAWTPPAAPPPSRWRLVARWMRNRVAALFRRETATETTGVYDAFDLKERR